MIVKKIMMYKLLSYTNYKSDNNICYYIIMEIKGHQLLSDKYTKIFNKLIKSKDIKYLIATISIPIQVLGKEEFLSIFRTKINPYLDSVKNTNIKIIFDNIIKLVGFDWKSIIDQHKIEDEGRSKFKAQSYTSILSEMKDEFKNKTIIDIGSMNGTITSNIVKDFKFKNGYYTDLIEPQVKINDKKLTFIKNDVNKIPIKEDKNIMLITLFHVFHHISDIPSMMSEIKRLSNEGGYLLIVDHDVKNLQIFNTLNLIHGLYEYVRGETDEWFNINNGYYAKYYKITEITNILKNYGFEFVKMKPYTKKYDIQNRYILLYKFTV